MPEPKISSRTRGATLKKQGHTATSKFGQDPNFKGKNKGTARDLSMK